MKLSRILLIAAMVGILAALGCGDDGDGSSNGDGGNGNGEGDPDVICADCAPGFDEEDCRNDVLFCNTTTDPGAEREQCLSEAAC